MLAFVYLGSPPVFVPPQRRDTLTHGCLCESFCLVSLLVYYSMFPPAYLVCPCFLACQVSLSLSYSLVSSHSPLAS